MIYIPKNIGDIEFFVKEILTGLLTYALLTLIKILILPPMDIISNFKENCNNFSLIISFVIIWLFSVVSEELNLQENILIIWLGLLLSMITLYI